MNSNDNNWKCAKCDMPLVKKKTLFTYLGHNITYEVSRCPKCGSVFIPKELAEGKMAEVEAQLEDK